MPASIGEYANTLNTAVTAPDLLQGIDTSARLAGEWQTAYAAALGGLEPQLAVAVVQSLARVVEALQTARQEVRQAAGLHEQYLRTLGVMGVIAGGRESGEPASNVPEERNATAHQEEATDATPPTQGGDTPVKPPVTRPPAFASDEPERSGHNAAQETPSTNGRSGGGLPKRTPGSRDISHWEQEIAARRAAYEQAQEQGADPDTLLNLRGRLDEAVHTLARLHRDREAATAGGTGSEGIDPAERRQFLNTLYRPGSETPDAAESTDSAPAAFDDVIVTALNNAEIMKYTGDPLWEAVAGTSQQDWVSEPRAARPLSIEPSVNTPGLEIKYRIADRHIANAAQVMDLGSGVDPRGVVWAQNHPGQQYVEVDLPAAVALKARVVQGLEDRGLVTRTENFHTEAGNVVDPDSILRAARHFDPGRPVTVTSFGILHYMDLDERAAFAESVVALLRQHPGSTFSTDMPVEEGIGRHDSPMASTTTQQTGRDVAGRRFPTNQAAEDFFAERGLVLESRTSYVDPEILDQLRSPELVGATREQIVERNRPWYMWTFRLSDQLLPPSSSAR